MGLLNQNQSPNVVRGERGLIDRVTYNGDYEELVWKFPYDNFTTSTFVVVNETQEAIICYGGRYCDLLGPGTYQLESGNIPILQSILNLPYGGKTPFTAEIWYINKTEKRNIYWGTKAPIYITDIASKLSIPIRARGVFGIRIQDSGLFMKKLVGTLHDATMDSVRSQFIEELQEIMRVELIDYMRTNKIFVLDLVGIPREFSIHLGGLLSEKMKPYGISITNLNIEYIGFDPDDPQVVKLQNIHGEVYKLGVLGDNYNRVRSFDIGEIAAANEGMAGGIMGAGMSAGMGIGLGSMIGGVVTNATAPPPIPQFNNMAYYVAINNMQQGPFSIMQLQKMVQDGVLTRETLVWKQGMTQWECAANQVDIVQIFNN